MKRHYAPFGIQTIGSRVFVTYGQAGPRSTTRSHGQGRGFVDVYDLTGNFLAPRRAARPAQRAVGPREGARRWGRFGGDLLVGNFGDGQINAFEEMPNGRFEPRGTLKAADGKKLAIDGLWALEFGNSGANGTPNDLYFTAGPNDESDGLFGKINAS